MRLLLPAALLLLTGCGERWLVVTASGPPSALFGKTSFAFSSDFSKLSVGGKTVDAYVAEKGADTKASFEGDLKGMNDDLLKILKSNKSGWTFIEGGEAEVQVVSAWTFIEPGVFTAVFNMPTQTTTRISFAIGGQVVDEAEFKAYKDADLYHPSSGQRMRNCAEDIGDQVLDFLTRANKAAK